MKNKKLLILLCIPLIIAVMVLPLCSFTVRDTDNYEVYSSYSPWSVDYRVIYNSATGVFYTGSIDSILSVPVPLNSEGEVTDDYQSIISDYASSIYINSSTRIQSEKILVNIGGGASYQNSADIKYTCSNTDRVFITPVIRCSTVNTSDSSVSFRFFDVSGNRVLLNGSGNNVTGYATSTTIHYDFLLTVFTLTDNGNINEIEYNVSGDKSISTFDFNPVPFTNSILSEEPYSSLINADDVIYYSITEAIYEVKTTNLDTGFQIESYKSVECLGRLFPESVTSWGYTNIRVFEDEISSALGIAYNKGLSNAKNVWETFTDFLTTTIGGFLDMNLTPTITISSMLGIILSVTLVVAFLKIFAGG